MAERSKALRSGRSLVLQAWVRIPLLTTVLLPFTIGMMVHFSNTVQSHAGQPLLCFRSNVTHARTHPCPPTRTQTHACVRTTRARTLAQKTRTCYTHRRKHSGSHVQKRAHAMHTRPHARTHTGTHAHTGTKVDIFGIGTQMWERRINM